MKTDLNYRSVIRVMGVLFLVLGFALLPSLLVALIYGEYTEVKSFLITLVPCLAVGLLLIRNFNPASIKARHRDVYLVVTLSWLVSSLVGAMPLVVSGAVRNPVDAFFEICSGFSTTGATILTDIEGQARSILFWRSFTHWLGGMGIIVFMAALLPSMGIGVQMIAGAETPGPTLTKIKAKFSDTAKDLYKLYIAFTLVEMVLLMLGGLSLFDASVHSFGTVGTGGFSSYGDSIGHFQSAYVEWVIIVFMILCGINFNLYFLIPKKRIKEMFQDEELRWYLVIIGTVSALITTALFVKGGYGIQEAGKAIRDSVFHVVSVITTTGYATTDYDIWPTFCKMLILLITISGACSSSTGGGVKVIRILVALKFVRRGFAQKMHPNRVINLTLNKKQVPQQVATDIVYFIFLYIAFLVVGTVLVSFDGNDLTTNFTAALTCLSNVGPGLGGVGPAMNFAGFSNFSTLVLAILMIAGRLELFTFVMLFSPRFWNSNRV